MAGTYGLLGEKLGHSFSPQIHEQLADYHYGLYEQTLQQLEDFFARKAFDGLNVTIPYKKTVLPFLQEISPRAQRIGCVNTVKKRKDGTLYGDNTDYDGFLYLLKKLGVQVQGKKALVLGSGGGSLTARTVLQEEGAAEIRIISRNGEDNYQNLERNYDAQIIVNTTPVGMYPNNGKAPLDLTPFRQCEAVVDIIYNPARTKLLLDAERLGIPCINGLPMLVAQAKRACEIFTETEIAEERIDEITAQIERQTKNVILIGMPGCGKTTIGRALGKLCGRESVDIDACIVERIGKSIPEFFAEQGEKAFRKLETEVLSEVCKRSGLIISTGGGVVTQACNLDILRQNGNIIMLERPIEELSVAGRPVSQSRSVQTLAKERMPLYRGWSERAVACIGVRQTAEKIKEELKL